MIALKQTRFSKALDLASKVTPLSEAGLFEVASQSSGGFYVVDLQSHTCTCPDNQHRAVQCKHLWAAEMAQASIQDPDEA